MDHELIGIGALERYRRLVARVLNGGSPTGPQFRACRDLLKVEHDSDASYEALCMLLEGALADPHLSIEDTQVLVRLLKALALGRLQPGELL